MIVMKELSIVHPEGKNSQQKAAKKSKMKKSISKENLSNKEYHLNDIVCLHQVDIFIY